MIHILIWVLTHELILARVRNALLDTEAKFGSALKDAKLDTGPGDDGQVL